VKKEYKINLEGIYFSKAFNKEEVLMAPIKALLTGLAGASLCMADISGIVTDTGTTPIPNAIVQLETGGQIDTTDGNGNFTLTTTTAILPVNGKQLLSGMSARISGNELNLTIAEQSAVEITTFDLNGKAISTMRKTLNAGSQSIALPQRSAGINLYKVKAGNNELVLKGNSVDGVLSGSAVSSQISSSKALAKHAKTHSAINDVIAVTKDGYLNYRVVVYNSDTSGIAIKMIASSGTVTDTEGNVYQTVQIGNQVWMAENLRVTKFNDGIAITEITDNAAWANIYNNNLATPAYCYYNNTTNADSIKKFGALYKWYVVNTGKLAPTGWHVPTDSEWTIMEKYLVLNGYNWDGTKDTANDNKIAKSLAAKTDWHTYTDTEAIGCDLTKNNNSGFSALPGGFRYNNGTFDSKRYFGDWWSATESDASLAYGRVLDYDDYGLYRNYNDECCGFSVRLVKD
jgi:uncharacterized protein (TIGR02145 family)